MWGRWSDWARGGVYAARQAASAALDLLFPPQCAFCRKDLPERALAGPGDEVRAAFCQNCRALLSRPRPTSCAKCGAALAAAAAAPPDCPRCRDRKFAFRTVVYLGTYEQELQAAVLRTKHARQEVLLDALADLLWEQRGPEIAAFAPEAIVSVPMHWRRRWWRGISGAERLGQRLARHCRAPFCPLLRRLRATLPQGNLHRRERFRNVRRAFGLRRGWRTASARLLLVDDVMTTGATVSGCTQVLLAAGAAEVLVAVVARAEGPS